jgi:predicted branched-subunit amino acid permease
MILLVKIMNYITIVFTMFILNLRHIIMSICIMEKMEKTSLPIRLLLSFGITDEVFAMGMTDKKINKLTPAFFAGLSLFSYLSWNVGSALGILFSSVLPSIASKSLGVSLYAMFIGLLVPNMKKSIRLLYVVVLTMLVNWVLNQFLSSSLSMLISTLGCALIGMCFISKEDLQ